MAQADIDQITTELTTVKTDLATSSAALQKEIDALAAANPTVSLTALKAAADALDLMAAAAFALVTPDVAVATPPLPPAP